MAEPLLEFSEVRGGYGEAVVLDGVSFAVSERGSLAVLGRNGAGKTTLLLAAMGFVAPSRGAIRFKGQDITHVAPHRRAHMGLGWVPQEREVFPSLTVEENLIVTARPGRWNLDGVYGLLPRLKERRGHKGNHLSGGEQQMLTIGRTLMTNPSVLLLDEPLEGLAPIIIEELTAAIRRMTEEEGTTLVLVEQHAEAALALTKDAILLERGVIAHRAESADLLHDHATLERYLGLKLDFGGSLVRTAFLEMRLDHDSGSVSGRVTSGRHSGQNLDDLAPEALRELLREIAGDADSVALFEVYLDRRIPGWREDFQHEATGRAPSTDSMREEEAYQVLGLAPGASPAEIRAAYRRLMKLVHPDQGGSTFLAAKINQAKDKLLGGHN